MQYFNYLSKWKIISLRLLLIFLISGIVYSCEQKPQTSVFEKEVLEPVKYIGERQPDERFYDGKLPHAMGVHHYQVFRANRTFPSEGGDIGWTYNHQPFLAYWKGKFYLQYLSDLSQEHTPPGRTLLVTSNDGRHWSDPAIIFPEYTLPEINFKSAHIPAGTKSVMHQRMGFYVAPNGRLLTLAFYSYCETPRTSPNAGNGLGRVVREIYPNGSLGPIHFIRYNRHAGWNETNTAYPFYKESRDEGFLEACQALLADKLITLQWWEEDRAEDGFYVINPGDVKNATYFSKDVVTSMGAGKAFNFFHRADGIVVGLWKNQYGALSTDNGKTWEKITKNRTLMTDGAKTWGQRTEDGRYVIVHNQSATFRNRFPMTSMVSDDGHLFDDLLCLRSDIPPRRFQGIHKRSGSQYYRGIIEGNGDPPGEDVWITYSVNKEDIWISRIHVPITGTAADHVDQDFEKTKNEADMQLWNLYKPTLAPIQIIVDPLDQSNHCLQLKDEEPLDYAKAERIFPGRNRIGIHFRFNPLKIALGSAMDVEVQDKFGNRPMRLRIDKDWLSTDIKSIEAQAPMPLENNRWYTVDLILDCEKQSYTLTLDNRITSKIIPFAKRVEELQRIVFRTGPYRNEVPPVVINEATDNPAGLNTEDLAGADQKVKASVYLIDDVRTSDGTKNE